MSFSPLITFVPEEPDETQNGIHSAKGNLNICLGNRGMGALLALRVEPRGQEAGLTTPFHFPRNLGGAGALWELRAFSHWPNGVGASTPVRDEDLQCRERDCSEEAAVDARRRIR